MHATGQNGGSLGWGSIYIYNIHLSLVSILISISGLSESYLITPMPQPCPLPSFPATLRIVTVVPVPKREALGERGARVFSGRQRIMNLPGRRAVGRRVANGGTGVERVETWSYVKYDLMSHAPPSSVWLSTGYKGSDTPTNTSHGSGASTLFVPLPC